MKSLSELIKIKREEMGYSLLKLSNLTGIKYHELSQIENGKKSKPSVDVIEKLSIYLGIPKSDLMESSGYLNNVKEYNREVFNNPSLQELIRENRKMKGLSMRELGKLINVSSAELSRIESGFRQKPSAKILIDIANILGIPTGVILSTAGYVSESNIVNDVKIS